MKIFHKSKGCVKFLAASLLFVSLVRAADFTVTSGNLILDNSTSSSTGNIIKGSNVFAHNYGSANTFLGEVAGNFSLTGNNCTAVGYNAGNALTSGGYNSAFGSYSLTYNQTGIYNTSVGYASLYSNGSSHNTALGAYAGSSVSSGTSNTFLGYTTGYSVTGSNNVLVGKGAGYTGTALTSGINNIIIGTDANAGAGTRTNGILLQTGTATALTANNQIRIGFGGTASSTCFIDGISGVNVTGGSAVYVNSSGQLGINSSSEVYKTNIQPVTNVTAKLMQLEPVTFTYKNDTSGEVQYGLIAEQVAEVWDDLVVRNENDQPELVQYHKLTGILVQVIQEQEKRIEALEKQLKKN